MQQRKKYYNKPIETRLTYWEVGVIGFIGVVFIPLGMFPLLDSLGRGAFALVFATTGFIVACVLAYESHRKLDSIAVRSEYFDALVKGRSWILGKVAAPKLTQYFQFTNDGGIMDFLSAFGGKDWKYADYRYVHVSNGRRQTAWRKGSEKYFSILELKLNRKLPHIFFDSATHGFQYKPLLDKAQRTSLEGNFDQYFTTYFPPNYHIDARSIISPEVMAAIMDAGTNDVEIYMVIDYTFTAHSCQ
jgi:hypothetical protein